jgi:hypothetical protein
MMPKSGILQTDDLVQNRPVAAAADVYCQHPEIPVTTPKCIPDTKIQFINMPTAERCACRMNSKL